MPEKPTTIQVVTWNVHFQGASVLDALKAHAQPDILTLQEVTFDQHRDFKERLGVMGFNCCPGSPRQMGGKHYGNLVATRWALDPVEVRYSGKRIPWPELLIQASVSVNGRSFLVVSVHIPNGSGYGWKKIDTFNALRNVVRKAKGKPCIVTGDFNEPRYELQDRCIVTWGQEWNARQRRFIHWQPWKDRSGRLGSGKQWDNAVRWLFEKEEEHGMRHAFWEAHGPGCMDVSHVNRGQPRWFDHMFVSRDFHVERCEYLHEVRLGGQSDHSALSATLVLAAQH
jgi:endonuclease/exonuclease/phosphatase family metal-dependent hydrolase